MDVWKRQGQTAAGGAAVDAKDWISSPGPVAVSNVVVRPTIGAFDGCLRTERFLALELLISGKVTYCDPLCHLANNNISAIKMLYIFSFDLLTFFCSVQSSNNPFLFL